MQEKLIIVYSHQQCKHMLRHSASVYPYLRTPWQTYWWFKDLKIARGKQIFQVGSVWWQGEFVYAREREDPSLPNYFVQCWSCFLLSCLTFTPSNRIKPPTFKREQFLTQTKYKIVSNSGRSWSLIIWITTNKYNQNLFLWGLKTASARKLYKLRYTNTVIPLVALSLLAKFGYRAFCPGLIDSCSNQWEKCILANQNQFPALSPLVSPYRTGNDWLLSNGSLAMFEILLREKRSSEW